MTSERLDASDLPRPRPASDGDTLPLVSRRLDAAALYWAAMFAASAFGTNLGDFWVDDVGLSRIPGFASLALLCVFATVAHARFGARTLAAYWVAIVCLRAAATNLADFLTHDLGAGFALCSLVLCVATVAAGVVTRRDSARPSIPLVDARYWIAMLLAGVFGTVAGDWASHTLGLEHAAIVLGLLLLIAVALQVRVAVAGVLGYWLVVLVERCAATPFGDSLASRHGIGLGLPVAMVCTGGLLLVALLAGRVLSR